jgi:hypothetical protein
MLTKWDCGSDYLGARQTTAYNCASAAVETASVTAAMMTPINCANPLATSFISCLSPLQC